MLCKNFASDKGCSYGDKCQFAHGPAELRAPITQQGMTGSAAQKNPLNFKIVKCKNFERDGNCKYGGQCTFAHGDSELRTKTDNYTQSQQAQMGMLGNFVYDVSMMPPQMQTQMGMIGFDPQMMMGVNPMDMQLMMQPAQFQQFPPQQTNEQTNTN